MKRIFLSLMLAASLIGGGIFVVPTFAADTTTQDSIDKICKANPNASVCADLQKPGSDGTFSNVFTNIVNILLYVVGVIAVVMIVVSGIRMTVSRGKPDSVSKARNSLLYSIVGLVIAVSAYAIVNFVLSRL